MTTKLLLYPEEKFVAMYTAAQTAGEQVDLLNLNGQDLRRYATAFANYIQAAGQPDFWAALSNNVWYACKS